MGDEEKRERREKLENHEKWKYEAKNSQKMGKIEKILKSWLKIESSYTKKYIETIRLNIEKCKYAKNRDMKAKNISHKAYMHRLDGFGVGGGSSLYVNYF